MNSIKQAFGTVIAEESLKKSTMAFLQDKRAKKERSFRHICRYAAACAVMLVVIFGIDSYRGFYTTAVSYISIDINPSIELALNRFNNVVAAAAYNEEGIAVLSELDLKGKPYTEAIDSLLENQGFTAYLKENDRLDFTVVSDKQGEIIDGIQGCLEYGQYNGYCHSVDRDLAAKALEQGLSVGKYRAYTELVRYDETVTVADCKNMTVKQIYDRIKEHAGNEVLQEMHHDNSVNQHNKNGRHHGNRN